ncbi:MAG: hypothetical protein GY810_09575 [Aureispira sp.]|nr:hypothetical protein [Aureispira sp.]
MISYLSILHVCLLLISPTQLNQWHNYTEANIKFWIPDNWNQTETDESETDYLMEFSSPDEAVAISFSVMAATDLEASLDELDRTLGEQLKDIEMLSEPELIEMNGLQGVMTEIKGEMAGQAVQMGVFVLDTDGQILLILGLAQEKAMRKHGKTIDKVMKSIKLLEK